MATQSPLGEEGQRSCFRSGTRYRIAILLKSLRGGGAERVLLTLAASFADLGHEVDLLVGRMHGPLLGEVPESASVHELKPCSTTRLLSSLGRLPCATWSLSVRMLSNKVPKIVRTLPALESYLRRVRPQIMLSTLPKANVVAAWAVKLARTDTALILREANQFSTALNQSNRFDRLLPHFARRWYPSAHGIIAVSKGVMVDLSRTLNISEENIRTILNPVDVNRIGNLKHAGLANNGAMRTDCPMILGVGKLTPQKDFETLLRAVALVPEEHSARLVILGEGQLEARLRALAAELGIADQVEFPGHVDNPYVYMRQAAVFVLSSAWEGCPNVLLEALACGCAVVSTDCPSGPREILQSGRFGLLVPVGNSSALATAIQRVLSGGGVSYSPHDALTDYTVAEVSERYLQVFQSARNRC